MFRFNREIFLSQFTLEFGGPGPSAQSGLAALLDQIEADDSNWANIYSLAYGLALSNGKRAIRFSRTLGAVRFLILPSTTGHRLAAYFPDAGSPAYIMARHIINGSDHAQDIAEIAQKMEAILKPAQLTGTPVAAGGSSSS